MGDNESRRSAQDRLQQLEDLADEMQLDDRDRDNFINSSMKRLGYKPRMDWDDPEPEDGGRGGGDFFSSRREERQQRRDVGGGRQQPQRRAGSAPFGYE